MKDYESQKPEGQGNTLDGMTGHHRAHTHVPLAILLAPIHLTARVLDWSLQYTIPNKNNNNNAVNEHFVETIWGGHI